MTTPRRAVLSGLEAIVVLGGISLLVRSGRAEPSYRYEPAEARRAA